MPSWPTATNWPTGVNWPTGGNWPTGVNWPAGGSGPPPPPLNFADLFPTTDVLLSSQTDLGGLGYTGTLSPVAGNASSTVMVLTGPVLALAVPIWLRFLAGGTADIYYDGIGVTPAMAGVPCAVGVPIPLTGAAVGITITPTGGGLVAGDTWKATCGGLLDQSGNAKHFSTSSPPLVSAGPQGNPGLIFDGLTNFMISPLLLPQPSITPYRVGIVYRMISWNNFARVFSGGDPGGNVGALILNNVVPNMVAYNGAVGPDQASPLGAWEATEVYFSNSANDSIRRGSQPSLSTIPYGDNVATTGFRIGGVNGQSNIEFLHAIVLKGASATAMPTTWRAAVAAKYGPAIAV